MRSVFDEGPVQTRLPTPARFHCPLCGRSTIRPHTHHILPREWNGPDTPDNKIKICAACHNDAHAYLDWLESRDGVLLPWPQRRLWHYKVRRLAERGWAAYQAQFVTQGGTADG